MIPHHPSPIKCRQSDLREPVLTPSGYIRAYCHLHGSDHQRSLSIHPATGWGHCFACQAVVLVEDLRSGNRTHTATAPQHHEPPHPYATASAVAQIPAASTPPSWQQEERRLLQALQPLMQDALMCSWKAQVYLEERRIPLALAQATSVGYLGKELLDQLSDAQRSLLRRWADRLLFPLGSPVGVGFIGRSLWHWKSGMDEQVHKHLLDQPEAPQRWLKTSPAGWFGFTAPATLSKHLILVEGSFDRLALLAAGLPSSGVVAFVGTAADPTWFRQQAPQVRSVLLALDSDRGGTEATQRLRQRFTEVGLAAHCCQPPVDGWGKDWSERWRRIGHRGLEPLAALTTPTLAR